MMEHIERTVKRLCDWIDKHADECGPEHMEFASVVQATAQLAQIAAGVHKKETAGDAAVDELTCIHCEHDLSSDAQVYLSGVYKFCTNCGKEL